MLATPADGFPTIDGALLGWRVERALAWRKQLGLPGRDHAYRMSTAPATALPGFTCDVLGRVAVVYAYGDGLRALGKQLAEAIVGFARLDGAVVKLRARGGADDVPQEVVGTAPRERAIVTRARRAVRGPSARRPQRRPVHRHARAPPRPRALRAPASAC